MHAIYRTASMTGKTEERTYMETLQDNMIDESTAKYFCIFAGKDMKQFFTDVNDNKKIADATDHILDKGVDSNLLKESILGKVKSLVKNKILNGKDKVQAIAKDTVQKTTAASTQQAINILTNAQNAQKINQMAADAGANATKGAIAQMQASQGAIDAAAASAGSAAAKGALDTAIGIATPWLIGAAVMTIGAMLWPKVKGAFNKMLKTSAQQKNSLAFVKFNDTEGSKWQFYFSKDKMLWKLDNMDSGENVTKNFTIDFMKTNFAKRFMARCQQIMSNGLNNLEVLQKTVGNDGKQYIEFLMKNKDKICNNMFNGKC